MLEDDGKWQCEAENAKGYIENGRLIQLVVLGMYPQKITIKNHHQTITNQIYCIQEGKKNISSRNVVYNIFIGLWMISFPNVYVFVHACFVKVTAVFTGIQFPKQKQINELIAPNPTKRPKTKRTIYLYTENDISYYFYLNYQ